MVNFNGETVMVTGATGYIGAQVVSLLLPKGYRVRAAVRSKEKADALAAAFPCFKDRIEFVFVDLSSPDSFNDVLSGLTGVFHIASPVPGSLKKSVKADYLDPAIHGTLGLLRAASRTPSIKRIAITSSIASVLNASTDPNHVVTEKDWNPITYEQAETIKLDSSEADFYAYIAAKALSEKAAFDFIDQEKPNFDIVTLLPSFVFGPVEKSATTNGGLSSMRFIKEYITTKSEIEPVHPWHLQVDVRDVAMAHVLAYENAKASNQRYLLVNQPFSWQGVVEIAQKFFEGKTHTPPLNHLPLPSYLKVDNSKSKNELGIAYRMKNVTFYDSIKSLLEMQKAERKKRERQGKASC